MIPKYTNRFARAIAPAVLLLALPYCSAASTMLFASGPTTLGGLTVNVSAEFDFDPTNHKITLTLLNLENDPSTIDQVLGSVRFTLNNAGTAPVPAIDAASTSVATFDVLANRRTETDDQASTWTLNPVSTGSTQMVFCTICATTAGREMIIGGPAASLLYASADNTIRVNWSGRNPYILGSGGSYASGALHNLDSVPSWTFSVPTMTAATTVSSVIFGFGTTVGANYGTYDLEVDSFTTPEPGTWVSMAAGLPLIAVGSWKRRPHSR